MQYEKHLIELGLFSDDFNNDILNLEQLMLPRCVLIIFIIIKNIITFLL